MPNSHSPWYWEQLGFGRGVLGPLGLGFPPVMLVAQGVEAGQESFAGVMHSLMSHWRQSNFSCPPKPVTHADLSYFLACLPPAALLTWVTELALEAKPVSCDRYSPYFLPSTSLGGKIFRMLPPLSLTLIRGAKNPGMQLPLWMLTLKRSTLLTMRRIFWTPPKSRS